MKTYYILITNQEGESFVDQQEGRTPEDALAAWKRATSKRYTPHAIAESLRAAPGSFRFFPVKEQTNPSYYVDSTIYTL